jgi:hypothetical protein
VDGSNTRRGSGASARGVRLAPRKARRNAPRKVTRNAARNAPPRTFGWPSPASACRLRLDRANPAAPAAAPSFAAAHKLSPRRRRRLTPSGLPAAPGAAEGLGLKRNPAADPAVCPRRAHVSELGRLALVTAGSRGCLSVACFVKGADPSIVGSSAPNRQIFTNGTHESPFATAFGATLSFHIDLMAFGVAASVRFAFLDSCRSEVVQNLSLCESDCSP